MNKHKMRATSFLAACSALAVAATAIAASTASAAPPDLGQPRCDVIVNCGQPVACLAPCHGPYERAVLADRPAAFYPLGGHLQDISGNNLHGSAQGAVPKVAFPDGRTGARRFSGGSHVSVLDNDLLSVPANRALTVEAWIRPDVADFPSEVRPADPTGRYVHWIGKGARPGEYEYAGRIYSSDSDRPRRVSAYAFNPGRGEGNGSYFQPGVNPCAAAIVTGRWIHVAMVINTAAVGPTGHGYAKIYRDGVLCDTDDLFDPDNPSDNGIDGPGVTHPQNGTAPFKIGTRGDSTSFVGAIARVAVYQRELPSSRVAEHFKTGAAALNRP